MPHHDFLNSEYLQTDLGHQLPLSAYLLKPMQRLTKYQLLLKVGIRMRDDENFKFINDVCYKRNNDDVHCTSYRRWLWPSRVIFSGWCGPLEGGYLWRIPGDIYRDGARVQIGFCGHWPPRHHTHHIIPPTTVSATHIRKSHQKERKAKAQSLRNDITRQLVWL